MTNTTPESSPSTPVDDRPARKSRRRLPPWRTVVRRTLLIVLVVVALQLLAAYSGRTRLQRAQERVTASGQSLKYADFVPPQVADHENASIFLETAGELLNVQKSADPELAEELHFLFRAIDREGKAVSAEDLELFRRTVDDHEVVLRVLDEALPRERARYDADYGRVPTAIEIPNLLRRLRFSSLLRVRAWLAADAGRTDEAYREVAKVFRLASWCAEEMPTMIHALIATAIARQGSITVEALAQVAPPSADAADHLLREAKRWDPRATFGRGLEAERAATVSTLLDRRAWRSLTGEFPLIRRLLDLPRQLPDRGQTGSLVVPLERRPL